MKLSAAASHSGMHGPCQGARCAPLKAGQLSMLGAGLKKFVDRVMLPGPVTLGHRSPSDATGTGARRGFAASADILAHSVGQRLPTAIPKILPAGELNELDYLADSG